MKAKRFLPVIILIACLIMSSCTIGFDDENLLQPPKNTGREAAIQELIEKAAGGQYLLKYPKGGDYRSAIVTADLNSDEIDEAVAFYRAKPDEAVHMLVMRCVKDKWKTCTDFKTAYTDVNSITFADYNFDGVLDILAGFTTSGDVNELNIFNLNFKTSKAVRVDFTAKYSSFTTGDFDGDGGSEIITLSLTSAESEAAAGGAPVLRGVRLGMPAETAARLVEAELASAGIPAELIVRPVPEGGVRARSDEAAVVGGEGEGSPLSELWLSRRAVDAFFGTKGRTDDEARLAVLGATGAQARCEERRAEHEVSYEGRGIGKQTRTAYSSPDGWELVFHGPLAVFDAHSLSAARAAGAFRPAGSLTLRRSSRAGADRPE